MVRSTASDDGERKVLGDIAKYGWHCLNILQDDEDPPWSFTIGLFETWKHAELIVIGLKSEVAHSVFNIIVEGLRRGHRPHLDLPSDELLEGYNCRFVKVSTDFYRAYVGFARWFYEGNNFPL